MVYTSSQMHSSHHSFHFRFSLIRIFSLIRLWRYAFIVVLVGSVILLPAISSSLYAQDFSSQPLISTIQRIRNRGNTLIVGVAYDYPPFGFIDANGVVQGFEPDLVRALADQWDVSVTFVPVTPATRLRNLQAGQIDLIAAALPHTLETETAVDFSSHYYRDRFGLLLNAEEQVVDVSTLSGRTIATVQGDVATTQLDAYLAAAGTNATLLPFQEYAPALLALKAGQANVLLADQTYLSLVAREELSTGVILPLAGEHLFGFGVAPGDSLFRNLVDVTLQEIYINGTYAEVYAKWFPNKPLLAPATRPGTWPYRIDTLPASLSPAQASVAEVERHSHLSVMLERGKLLVGVRYDMPPFGALDGLGEVQGFEIDLARELARRWLDDEDALELVRVTPDTAIPLLNAKQIDLIAAALPHTWAHEAAIDFGDSYYRDALGALVRADSTVTTLSELNGRLLATVTGIDAIAEMKTTLADINVQVELLPFQEYRTAQQALLAGQVDAVIGSTTVLSASVTSDSALRLLSESLIEQPYGIGIPQFEEELRDLVNITVQAMRIDGTYDALYAKWFSAPPAPAALWLDNRETVGSNRVDSETLGAQAVIGEDGSSQEPSLPAVVVPTVTASIVGIFEQPDEGLQTSVTLATPTSPVVVTIRAIPTRQPASRPILIPTAVVENVATSALQQRLPTTVTVASSININARAQPTVNSPILALVEADSSWPVFALSGDEEWIQIELPDGQRGWLFRRFLTEAGEIRRDTAPTATPTPPVTLTQTPTPTTTPTNPTTATSLPPAVAAVRTHRIDATDTLASISQEYYGTQTLWRLIYEANREVIGDDPNVIPLGAELLIPEQP